MIGLIKHAIIFIGLLKAYVSHEQVSSISPFPVEQAMRQLGENLRVARIRRNMTIADVAERIGTGPRAVMDAERGKPATGIVVYAALLWLYDKIDQVEELGDPLKDKEALALVAARERQRARKGKGMESDF